MADRKGDADEDDGVIRHIPDEYQSLTHAAKAGQPVTVLSEEESKAFRPMIWPIMDNGKEKTTNAYGYPTGGWYKDQMDMIYARRQARKDAEEAARAEQERHAREAIEKEKQEEEITVARLEDVIKEAHEEGYNAGFEKGHQEGFAKGEAAGQQQGYDAGFARGSEKGYHDGMLKGQEEGFAQGQSQGLQNGEELVSTQVNRFRRIADMLANPMRQVDRDVTDELVYLVSRLARVVIKHDVQHDPEFLRATINHALEVLPNFQKGATIFLNDDDLSLVTTLVGEEYIEQQHWDLRSDPALEHGDLRVTNDISSVEWKLNDRIDELLDTFLQSSAPAVDGALREHIDDFPEHDETPLPLVAPRPVLKSAQARAAEAQEAAAAETPEQQQQRQELEQKQEQEKRIADAHEKRKFFKETKEKLAPQAVAAIRKQRQEARNAAASAPEAAAAPAAAAEAAAPGPAAAAAADAEAAAVEAAAAEAAAAEAAAMAAAAGEGEAAAAAADAAAEAVVMAEAAAAAAPDPAPVPPALAPAAADQAAAAEAAAAAPAAPAPAA